MTETGQRSSNYLTVPIAILTSPIVVVGCILSVSVFILSTYQQATNVQLRGLASEIVELNKEQSKILTTHKILLQAVSDLENNVRFQKNRLSAVDSFAKENNIIITGVPERDGENLEATIRDLMSKRLSLNFGDIDLELVRRSGRKYAIPGGAPARKVVVKFSNYLDKVRVLNVAGALNGTMFSISDDTRTLFSNTGL